MRKRVAQLWVEPSTFQSKSRFHLSIAVNTFFSDYCTGVIRSLNPENGLVEDTIMVGADFLSNMVTAPWGDLYYLSFSLGELNRISYIGDGSPFIAKHPKEVLAVVGEDAPFEIEAYGDNLKYQWFQSDKVLEHDTNANLTLTEVLLKDKRNYSLL